MCCRSVMAVTSHENGSCSKNKKKARNVCRWLELSKYLRKPSSPRSLRIRTATNTLSQTEVSSIHQAMPEFVAETVNNTERTFSLYVHVPFCLTRCGYCDFNTYISPDMGPGASHDSYAATAIRELEFAATTLENSGINLKPLHSVSFGGGTPTLLPAEDLAAILDRAKELFGIRPGAEVTTEANPDSLTQQSVATLAEGGFNRISMGMQSSVS